MIDTGQPTNDSAPRMGRGHAGQRINLVRLAQAQRWLIWCIPARLILEFGSLPIRGVGIQGAFAPAVLMLYLLLWLGVQITTIYFIVKLARAYGYNTFMAVVGGIAIVLPCIGLLLLVLLNQRVIKVLQEAGAKVGFMGVNADEMNKLREGVCSGCGYPIRGLTGPVCPECGATLPGTPAM